MARCCWLICLLLVCSGCASAPTTGPSTFHRQLPDPVMGAKLDKIAVRANKILMRPGCVKFFSNLPDALPEGIGIDVGPHPDPRTIAWSDCKAFPETVFINTGYINQLTVDQCARLSIHEAAHLAQCSTRPRFSATKAKKLKQKEKREDISFDAERACVGQVLSIVAKPGV